MRKHALAFWLAALLALPPAAAAAGAESAGAVLWQPSMNVFRRFAVDAGKMFEFYGEVLGFEQLSTIELGGGTGVARFQAGAQQLKLTGRVDDRTYVEGGVRDATGLRLLTFFFADEAELAARFAAHGLDVPRFEPVPGSAERRAFVTDPDGQWVELVVIPGATPEQLARLEVGLTVSDIEESRAFYRDFVGLEELPPAEDPRFGTTEYSFRHGATTITLRSYGDGLPADTGSGGIQYVVSDVDAVNELAQERGVVIDQPLSTLPGFSLRSVWLDDPDGITNYFAETRESRAARAR
ncbi:MAG TPA: VOC family protein [Gammaproteobacteria bacterium]